MTFSHPGGAMSNTIQRPAGWVMRKAGVGLKDLPRNLSWLASRARPDGHGDGDGEPPGPREERNGERASVDRMLSEADEASEAARAAELRAVTLAEEARERAEEANRVAQEASTEVATHVQEAEAKAREREEAARQEADEAVAEVMRAEARRVRRAQQDMDQRVERERQRAWGEAQKAIERVRAEAEERATTPDVEPTNGDAPTPPLSVTVTEVTVDEVTVDLEAAESEV